MVQLQHCTSNLELVQFRHCGIAQEQPRISSSILFQSFSMPPKLPPKIRKFEFGAEKRRKKKKEAELIES